MNEHDLEATRNDTDQKGKQPFTHPKLTFVEPKLEKQGDFAQITAGFFGTFNP